MNPSINPQPNEILKKERLAPSITLFEVHTPLVAETVRAGQFVVVRADDYAERIPLTVVDSHPDRGSITLIVQVVGVSTRKMDNLNVGGAFLDVVGPLGKPTEIKKVGNRRLHRGRPRRRPRLSYHQGLQSGREPHPFDHRGQDQGDVDPGAGDAGPQR